MKLIIKPISSLLPLEFIVPNYQRGYRWDSEQIEALLNDLKDFVAQADKGMFYCLQPVVVVKESEKSYIVVDGQQRLTTLYLMMHLRGLGKKYSISLPGRDRQDIFLKNEVFADSADKTYLANIDNFYLRKAYDTMREWAADEANEEEFDHFKYLFTKSDSRYGYVSVIWYDISEETGQTSPERARRAAMAAFRRLNYGKIPLTSAELIKALLLQTDLYPEAARELQRAVSQRRAMEWDEMEHRLANPLFASMVCGKDSERIKGISIILDLLADRINKTLQKPQKRRAYTDEREDLFPFHVIDRKIREDTEGMKDPADDSRWLRAPIERSRSVSEIWSEVQRIFNILSDWFENREWFHLIGMLRQISRKPSSQFISTVASLGEDKREEAGAGVLRQRNKSEFRKALKKAIGKELRVDVAKENDEPLPADRQGLASPNLRYNEREQRKMIHILTAMNVKMIMDDPNETAYFPFHLFRKHNATSLEHIHPQNITESLDFEEAKRWLADRKQDFLSADKEVWGRVARSAGDFKDDGDEESEEFKAAVEEARRRITHAIETAEGMMGGEETYNDKKDEIFSSLRILDRMYGDMAGISESDLHSIWNMALVPQNVNSALGNSYLDRKREILLDYKDSSFIPPATLKVFSKGYRPGCPGNMKFWQPEDREAYRKAIQDTYDYFTTEE